MTQLTESDCESRREKSLVTRIADVYFEPKSFEKWQNGRVYELLGVKYVQKAIMATAGRLVGLVGRGKATSYFIGRERH